MFDLFRSRDKAVRILLGAVLTVVALSMLVYLIPGGFGSSTGGPDDQVVAEVGKQALSLREVEVQVQNLRRNRQIPNDLLHVYVPQLIDQMITERAIAYEARRLGYVVTDSELADAIQAASNGQFQDVAVYKRYIEDQGMTVPEFESSLRDSLLMNRLQSVAMAGVVVTPAEIQQEYDRVNEKVKVEYVLFSENTLQDKIKPTPADLNKFFTDHRASYQIPEERNATVLVVDQAKVAASIQIPDTQALAFYNANLDQYRTPERVNVRHILLTTTGKSPQEVEQIRKKAEELLKQVRAGADFADLAKKNSQDPGSAANGGDLGWIVRGQTVKNFESAAFSLKPKQISDLVTTEYGFHILQVMDHQDAHVKPFTEVKNDIALALKKQDVNQRMQALADQAQRELAKTPQNAQQIASQLGLTLIAAQKLGPSDPVPGLVAPALSTAIAALKPNEVSQPVAIGDQKIAFAVCTAILPAHPAEFADVATAVRRQYVTEQALKLAAEDGTKAAAELKSGKDIAAVAKAYGVQVKSPEPFSRVGAIEGVGPASVLDAAFHSAPGAVIGPLGVAGQTVVAKLVEKIPSDPSKLAGQRDALIAQIKGRRQQERMSLFEDSVRSRLVQEGKIKIHKDVINRLVASYQS